MADNLAPSLIPSLGYQGYGAQNPANLQSAMAQRMLMEGSSAAPATRTQGMARLAQAIMGGLLARQQMNQQQEAASSLANAPMPPIPGFGGGTPSGGLTTPGATPPANAPAPNAGPMSGSGGAGGGFAIPGTNQVMDFTPADGGYGPMADKASFQGGQPSAQDSLSLLKGYISNKESGGNYDILGPTQKNGDYAIGKYQVMASNVPSWTQSALGQSLTPEQFRASPVAQEAVANHQLGGYLNKYGPEGAANAWFTGSPHPNPNARDSLGTTALAYSGGANAAVNGAPSPEAGATANPEQLAAIARSIGGGSNPLLGAQYGGQDIPAANAMPASAEINLPPQQDPAVWMRGRDQPTTVANFAGGAQPGFQQPPSSAGATPGSSGLAGGGSRGLPFNNPFQGLLDMLRGGSQGGPPAPVSGMPGGMTAQAPQTAPAGNSGPPDAQMAQMQDYYRQMMSIALNPMADQMTREIAMQRASMVQNYMMPHPTQWIDAGGGKMGINPLTGQPIQGQFIPDMKPTVIGKDMYGNDRYGIVNAQTGKVTPLDTGGMQQPQPLKPLEGGEGVSVPAGGVPAGQPPQLAPSGVPQGTGTTDIWASKYVPGYGKIDQLIAANPQLAPLGDLAKQILRGDAKFPEANTRAGTSQYDANLRWLVNQADPNFSVERASARNATIKSFQTGTDASSPGGLILNANTALGHLQDLAKASEALGQFQYNNGALGGVANTIGNHIGGQEHQDALNRYKTAVAPFVDEMGKFFAGSGGTEGMRESLQSGLSPDATPEARRAAIQQFATMLQTKAGELQNKWHQSMGQDVPDFPVISPQGQSAIGFINGLGKPQEAAPNQTTPKRGQWNPKTGKVEFQ